MTHLNPTRENIPKVDLEHKCEALIVENNNLREKLSKLESENKSVNIRLEIVKGQLSNKNDALENLEEEKDVLSNKNEAFSCEIKQAECKLRHFEKGEKEKDDNLLMLDLTLKNRNIEIESLKNELESMRLCFQCEECEFSSGTESDLKIHIEQIHQHICTHCHCSFVGQKKLETHTCRIKIKNPYSEKGYYTKDWFEKDKCIRVFDDSTKTEVANLHSEDCVEKNICTNFSDEFKKTGSFKDAEGITNLQATTYIKEETVDWINISIIVKIMNLNPNNLFSRLTYKK